MRASKKAVRDLVEDAIDDLFQSNYAEKTPYGGLVPRILHGDAAPLVGLSTHVPDEVAAAVGPLNVLELESAMTKLQARYHINFTEQRCLDHFASPEHKNSCEDLMQQMVNLTIRHVLMPAIIATRRQEIAALGVTKIQLMEALTHTHTVGKYISPPPPDPNAPGTKRKVAIESPEPDKEIVSTGATVLGRFHGQVQALSGRRAPIGKMVTAACISFSFKLNQKCV